MSPLAVFVWTIGDLLGGVLFLVAGACCLAAVVEAKLRDRQARKRKEREEKR